MLTIGKGELDNGVDLFPLGEWYMEHNIPI